MQDKWKRKEIEIEIGGGEYDGKGIEVTRETEEQEGKIMEREGREIVEEIEKCKLRARGAEASWNEWEKWIDGMRWKMG